MFERVKTRTSVKILPLQDILIPFLVVTFLLNQLLLIHVSTAMGMDTPMSGVLGMSPGSSKMIIGPKLNPDGKTTSLTEWPTITEVRANPHSGNALADAEVVMTAIGKPFYAPDNISFDDPLNAQNKWDALATSIQLSPDQETRYQNLISTMVCSYCCGDPEDVTINKDCSCAHAQAVRGFFRYMIQTYGSKFSDEQLIGEAQRWYAIWYPKGMIEDYLLATGNERALPHEPHGGSGPDGIHGLKAPFKNI